MIGVGAVLLVHDNGRRLGRHGGLTFDSLESKSQNYLGCIFYPAEKKR